jgi:hypothetical protein
MAKKEIRTKYIKSLVNDKDAMAKVLEESTKESLSSLLDEKVNRSLRQMLAESDDDSYEEEVTTEIPDMNQDSEENNGDETEKTDGDINIDLESGDAEDKVCKDGECEDNTEGDDVWSTIEDCEDSDGEYDLRGKDIESVIEILNTIKQMAPETDVRVIKTSDNRIKVEGEDETAGDDIDNGGEMDTEPNEFEFEIDTESDATDGDNTIDSEIENQDDDNENDFEIELGNNDDETNDDDMLNEGNVDLGYTTNYQGMSALTMPNDKGEGEGDSRFDGGAPKGGANNKKRWVGHDGQNGGNPYSNKTKQPMTEETNECGLNGCGTDECNEEALFEIDLSGNENMSPDANVDETHTRGMARKHNSVGRKEVPNTSVQSDEEDTRNVIVGAEQKRNCSKRTNESRMAEIDKQANTIIAENKELKNIAAQLKQQLSEAVLINASLAKVIRLVTENATSRDEKINILNRFNKVKSLNECKSLYTQISAELANAHSVNNNLLNKQLTEAKGQNKNMIVETNMLNQSEDLRQILDLNERLMRLGK